MYINVLLLICLSTGLIVEAQTTKSAQQKEMDNNITYSCDARGKITIDMAAMVKNKIKLIGLTSKDHTFCKYPVLSINKTKTQISNCTLGEQVIVMKELTNASSVVGGHTYQKYSLVCRGTLYTTVVVSAITVPTLTSPKTESITPSPPSAKLEVLSCTSASQCSTQAVTTLAVGQMVKLKASTNDPNYNTKIVDCTADDTLNKQSLLLWSEESCSKVTDIIDDSMDKRNGTASNTDTLVFYGFRFNTGQIIELSCTVRFCNKNARNNLPWYNYCKKGCGNNSPKKTQTQRRRKRSSFSPNTQTVSTILTVVDLPMNKGVTKSYTLSTVMAAILFCVTLHAL